MTTKELWLEYQHLTGNLTEHSRKLGFAGVAICWMFKDKDYTFPNPIYLALLGFVTFFLLDIAQYFFGALIIRHFTEGQEAKLIHSKKSFETPIDKPRSVDRPAFCLFILKLVALAIGFIVLGVELFSRLLAKHS